MTIYVNKEADREEHKLPFNSMDFPFYGGRSWSLKDGFSVIFSNTVKVCGNLFANFVSLIPIAAVSGCAGSLLYQLGVMSSSSAKKWDSDGLDLRATSSWILGASQLCYTSVSLPIEYLRKLLWVYTPSIEYDDIKLSKLFIATALEDIVCIGLIQRTALPLLANQLPECCGRILNHKVTRVVIASAIFALAHKEMVETSPLGGMPQFMGGLISGAVAELDNSLVVPIISHFAYDLILGAGRSSRFG